MIGGLPDASLDWAYLDAGHDYESVRRDLEALKPKIRRGGTIAGHDYVRSGRHGYRCGVIEAVNEFCRLHDWRLSGVSYDSHYPPSYAIEKG